MTIVARFSATRGSFALDVDMTVGDEIVVVRGRNGSGKSTFLHVVAGLLPVEYGFVSLEGRILDRRGSTETDLFVPPEERRIGYLPQGGALFPHLDALDNVSFGLLARGVREGSARRASADMLDRLGMAEMAERRPRQLSGGQRQRVALARTLVTEPVALLLDEPMNGLDDEGRADVEGMLRDLRSTFSGPIIVVSHDRGDTAILGARDVVMESARDDGRASSVLRG